MNNYDIIELLVSKDISVLSIDNMLFISLQFIPADAKAYLKHSVTGFVLHEKLINSIKNNPNAIHDIISDLKPLKAMFHCDVLWRLFTK